MKNRLSCLDLSQTQYQYKRTRRFWFFKKVSRSTDIHCFKTSMSSSHAFQIPDRSYKTRNILETNKQNLLKLYKSIVMLWLCKMRKSWVILLAFFRDVLCLVNLASNAWEDDITNSLQFKR